MLHGITLNAGDRILLINMSSGTPAGVRNGVWQYNPTGAWTRPDDYSASGFYPNFAGSVVVVEEGGTYGDVAFTCTSDTGVVSLDDGGTVLTVCTSDRLASRLRKL